MHSRRAPRNLLSRVRKDKCKAKNALPPKNRSPTSKDTAHVDVKLKLWSPTKAERWWTRGVSPGSSLSYNLTMANACDLGEDFLADRQEEMEESEDLILDWEDLVPDWEDYVDPHSDFDWIEVISGTATFHNSHSSVEEVAYCRAYLIRRDRIADTFWDDMEEPEHETAELAFELFNRFGCLQSKFKEHPVKRGSGVWGDELNYGDILLIEELWVSATHRRRGIGSRLAHAIMELASNMSENFIGFTRPGVLEREVARQASERTTLNKKAIRRQLHDISLSFCRKLNFRRIGSSSWFGYSPDDQHPSRLLAVDQDFDLPFLESVTVSQDIDSLMKSVPTLEDTKCLTRLGDIFDNAPLNDPRWEATNEDGDTLLHLLACSFKLQSMQWLMHNRPGLLYRQNKYGDTPLEALETSMEQKRTIHERGFKRTDYSDLFRGYDDPEISSLALLRGFNLDRMSYAERMRLKFGCTCGNCLGGFLSPRLRRLLIAEAESTFGLIHTIGDDMDGETWCSEYSYLFDYLPEPIALSFIIDKVSRTGFCMLWKELATCVCNNLLPTEENLLFLIRNAGEYPPYSREFIQKGGAISSVATMLFKITMQAEELYKLELEDTSSPAGLPTCRNDREIGMVSGMCGYETVSRVQYVTMRGKKIRF